MVTIGLLIACLGTTTYSLEQVPPIPTLQNGPYPLHRFLGFDKDRHIASLCLRNPLDTREMPPNGNTYVSANCVRGVKKVWLFHSW